MFEHSVDIFVRLVEHHRFFGYVVLFIAMMLEGEVFLIVAGMLASLRAFDIGDVLVISYIGVVLGNTLWYELGVFLKANGVAGRIIRWAERVMRFLLPRFEKEPFKSIFISKFIYSANRATVIMSGVLHVPFKLFFKAESLASILWVGLYAGVGYFFGYAAVTVTRNASRFVLLVVVFVIAFILIQKFATRRYERHEHQHTEGSNT